MSKKRGRSRAEALLDGVPEGGTDRPLTELVLVFSRDHARCAAAAAAAAISPAGVEIFSFEHESALMVTPPRSRGLPGITARPCVFGRSCVCMKERGILGFDECGGVVLMETLTVRELQAFHETGAHPERRRPCILCTRADVTDAYLRLRRSR